MSATCIEVQDLEYSYPKASRKALQGLHFAIQQGEIFGFLGPSGSGKSTTLKVLTGLLPGYQGHVQVLGQDPAALKGKARKRFLGRLGVAFEFPYLYDRFTARENLAFFGAFYEGLTGADRPDPLVLMERLGLLSAYDTRVAAYSKGMRMRLNLVRALVHGPELLFLDEPTSGLDPATANIVMDLIIEERAKGRAVFLTTHQMNVAERLCDRVAFIVDGRLALTDAPRALMLSHGQRRIELEWRDGQALRREDFAMDGLAQNQRFQEILASEQVETMHSREASLEDVFIKATGRVLE
jgi:fluoroquinolone transport system ATP-binding protein